MFIIFLQKFIIYEKQLLNMKKAVVFDNSGTLIERYRVIKDIFTGEIITDVNSLELIDESKSFALVVLQFNSKRLLDLDPEMLMSDVIKEFNIDAKLTFSSSLLTHDYVYDILLNEKTCVVHDITDVFDILKKKVPNMEICNGSAFVVDLLDKKITYTISSAGKLFPNSFDAVQILKSRGIELFIVSGDRDHAIHNLADILHIKRENAYGTTTTEGKADFVKRLQDDGYKVMMVGDGLNDVLAFEAADVSVLTIEQQEEVSPKLFGKTDFIIRDIINVCDIKF